MGDSEKKKSETNILAPNIPNRIAFLKNQPNKNAI